MKKIERALISVSDKTGIAEIAHQLTKRGVEIISTGGTAKLLKDEGVPITLIDDYTGFPEMLDGRVKTLHPKVHAGLLALRDDPYHKKVMDDYEIPYIDLVIVNLYPFEQTITKENVKFEDAIENIDIGGPTMLRSAAKNFRDVTVIIDPSDYKPLFEEMEKNAGAVSYEFNKLCAQKVFASTSFYDSLIANYLEEKTEGTEMFPPTRAFGYRKVQDLRYGENPHQKAAFYKETVQSEPCVTMVKQLHGKELSYNNFIDVDGAVELLKEFTEPTSIVVKHTNPCGAACAENISEAYRLARATDPISAFGSVLAFNRTVDKATAEQIASTFVEGVVAPDYASDALEILQKKKNIRILLLEGLKDWVKEKEHIFKGFVTRKVVGGLLVQERDTKMISIDDLKCVTKRQPTEEELKSLMFAWKCVKHVKSNAIVYANGLELVGVGAGQMSRVDSAKVGVMKAQKEIKGCVMASDAFFPFRDGIDAAAAAGITAIIEPGGSIRDEEVITAADEANIAMVFTGMRHFKH
ncbi:MAG: bifunctional phosphoribosylaminoimidazolecarboxamide formyltransferase/inosine monophosphate cyclohydrolase [Chlamydiae bacterium]|nr:MAG: bifunctional phosphoribosylaminoimidazolecarboxamide formyltransferase/inosine monophosphate cyclohydrolase [Chlamydiota bacterium]